MGISDNDGLSGALGRGGVTVGDTSGAADASLLIAGAYTLGRAVTVQGGSSGVATVGGTNTSGTATYAGTVTVGKNLTVTAASGGELAMTGTLANSGGYAITKIGGGTLTLSGSQSHGAGAALNVNAGTVKLNADGGTNLTVNVGSATDGAKVGALQIGAAQHMAALNVNNTSTATVTAGGSSKLVIVNNLSIAGATDNWTGKLDLNNNDMIIQVPQGQDVNAAYATLVNQLNAGAQGGVWTGTTGVTSSSAANSGYTMGLGAVPNAQLNSFGIGYTAFDNVAVDDHSILIKYTYMGDVNLDGTIDSLDYYFIDSAFNNNQIPENPVLTGYINGDFNYDGTIDSADYYFIDSNFNNLHGHARTMAMATPVPEPASLTMLALGAMGLLRRKK